MQLIVNGTSHTLDQSELTVQQLLKTLGYDEQSIAVAIDGAFVARNRYAQLNLTDQQQLEIVSPMQGG